MIIKWCLWGSVIGAIICLSGGASVIGGAILGGAIGIGIRKWIFRTFWH